MDSEAKRTTPSLAPSPVTPEFQHHIQTAEGFLELGMANDAAEALEDIEPELILAVFVLGSVYTPD